MANYEGTQKKKTTHRQVNRGLLTDAEHLCETSFYVPLLYQRSEGLSIMAIEIEDFEEAQYEVDRTSILLQAALRQSEDASSAVASYNRNPNAETRTSIVMAALSDAEITHEVIFQVFCNLRDIKKELERLANEQLKIKREGA